MTALPDLTFAPLAESALLVRLGAGQAIDPAVVAAVWALTAALDERTPAGVEDVVPAYATILVAFDPERTAPATLESGIRAIAASLPNQEEKPAREVVIPVTYGGDCGPDLADVAAHAGLTADEVVDRHAGASYRVACGGFAPGWDYLMGLPPELAIPRLANPRIRIPPGSVAIGGMQTGVYPLETPGGWRLIGRTPVRMFDPARDDPFLLHPGDRVAFRRIDAAAYTAIAAEVAAALAPDDGRGSLLPRAAPTQTETSTPTIQVIQAGMLTTVQDLGRPGLGRYGVAPGGALDRTALILGNRLVGNEPGEAALEMTLLGPTLRFTGAAVVAVTGADLGARLNGSRLPLWQTIPITAGDELSFSPESGGSAGVRAYLCVAGGLAIPPVLGSRSTDLVGRFGGLAGRALAAGDEIALAAPAPPADALLRRRLAAPPPTYDATLTARVTLGPQQDRFTDDGLATFLGAEFRVSAKANRTGVRLSGPAIAHTHGADLVSEGIAHGAVQVPGDGQPIVLLAGRQTVGGYVKIATVAGADLDRFAQLRPGGAVRFVAVSPAEAREATLHARATLGPDAVTESPPSRAGWSPAGVAAAIGGTAAVNDERAWTPDGVVRVIEAARAAGLTTFCLELAGLKLELHRGDDPASIPVSPATPPAATGETVVTAPVLGVFYRRGAPDQPPLVAEGDPVAPGQTIALIEVMKTYHEVQASHAATLLAFLVEDGAFVEYGQPLARLTGIDSPHTAP
jgi:KipI family sensor histidine kinase inhibitor